MERIVKQAYNISKKGLRKCYGRKGTYAALNHFRQYWARDGFFATFGSVYLKDYAQVRKEILLFIRHQKKNGHIPRIINRNGLINWIFVFFEKRFDDFSPFLTYFSRDQNSLFVIAAWEYIKKSKDYDFALKYFESFESAVNWNFTHDIDKDLLLEQGAYADWEDTVRKNPEGFFTNLMNYKGLLCLSEIAGWAKLSIKKKEYKAIAELVKEQINKYFWTGDFYSDSIKIDEKAKDQEKPIFGGGANMLAIYWDVAGSKRSRKIMQHVKEHNLEHFSIEVNYPPYPVENVLFLFRMARLEQYHNGMEWLWIGCCGALAYDRMGEKKKARHLLRKIARKIVEFKEVYEVYELTGEPVNRFFYKSAHPFAWSAGLFIYAVEKIESAKG